LLERSLTKRLQTAYAARSGVEAALLAEAGVTGPSEPLEGASGINALYTELDAALVSELGTRYDSLGMTFKKFASCMCNHAPIEAALRLAGRTGLNASDIDTIAVTVSPFMYRLTGAPFVPSDNPQVSAQFSVRYSVASALLRRRFECRDIEPSAVQQPEVNLLASRVEVAVDESAGRFGPASVRLRTRNGKEHSLTIQAAPGTPAAPLSETELLAKAHTCFTAAAVPMTSSHADALIEALRSLEKCAQAAVVLDSFPILQPTYA
jgi:2-methylcitrate dehydratase PrpD